MSQEFVLDALVTVAWALEDEKEHYPEGFRISGQGQSLGTFCGVIIL